MHNIHSTFSRPLVSSRKTACMTSANPHALTNFHPMNRRFISIIQRRQASHSAKAVNILGISGRIICSAVSLIFSHPNILSVPA